MLPAAPVRSARLIEHVIVPLINAEFEARQAGRHRPAQNPPVTADRIADGSIWTGGRLADGWLMPECAGLNALSPAGPVGALGADVRYNPLTL